MNLSYTTGIVLWLAMLIFGFSGILHLAERGNLLNSDARDTSMVYDYVEPVSTITMCKLSYVPGRIYEIATAASDIAHDGIDKALGTCDDEILGKRKKK